MRIALLNKMHKQDSLMSTSVCITGVRPCVIPVGETDSESPTAKLVTAAASCLKVVAM